MKRVLVAAFAATALFAGAASAQTSTTTTVQSTETTGAITIAPEKRTVLKQYVTREAVKPVEVKEKVTVGWTVPQTVELREVPSTLVTEVPAVRGYSYFVHDGSMVLVDPKTRQVRTIVE